MKRRLLAWTLILAATAGAQTPPARPAPDSGEIQKKVESYLRKLYAWDASFLVKVALPTDAPAPGFYQLTVEITRGNQSDSGLVYVSKDGRFLVRGELHDMSVDPFASSRAQIRLDGSPSRGPANAQVTVVEYSDFQCPHCRQLYNTLKVVEPAYPQVRFVFKDFPLTQIHPWAMTAAIAARCAYQQSPEAFWKIHDVIFDNQDSIKPDNAWQKVLDFASQTGLQSDAFRACMTSPEAKQAVDANIREGQALKIANTPTLFVNGRRLIAGDRALLEQYINYELATHSPPKP